MSRQIFLPSLFVVLLASAGCQSQLSHEEWGKTVGTLAGAGLGAKFGDDNRWLGAAIGATAGYFAGQAIGRYLSRNDQESLAAETVDALGAPSAGTTTWRSPESRAWAQIRTGEIAYTPRARPLTHLTKVETVPGTRMESREYQTRSALRVRSGPSTD